MHTVSEIVFINLLIPVHMTATSLPKHNIQSVEVKILVLEIRFFMKQRLKCPNLDFSLHVRVYVEIHLVYFEILFKT